MKCLGQAISFAHLDFAICVHSSTQMFSVYAKLDRDHWWISVFSLDFDFKNSSCFYFSLCRHIFVTDCNRFLVKNLPAPGSIHVSLNGTRLFLLRKKNQQNVSNTDNASTNIFNGSNGVTRMLGCLWFLPPTPTLPIPKFYHMASSEIQASLYVSLSEVTSFGSPYLATEL